MQDLNDKITGGTLTASEWNQVPSEIQNVITATGISLSGAVLDQMLSSISNIARSGHFYQDGGAVNNYVLLAFGQASTSYITGMEVTFVPNVANTGASVVNVDGLGIKPVKAAFGSPTDALAGAIAGLTTLIYDGTNFAIKSAGGNETYDNDTFVEFFKAVSGTVGVIGLDLNDDVLVGQPTSSIDVRGTIIRMVLGAGEEIGLTATQNAEIALFYNNIAALRTADRTATSRVSAATIQDASNITRDIGFNTMPIQGIAASGNITRAYVGRMIHYTGAAGTLTIETTTLHPLYSTWVVSNEGSANVVISGGASVLTWFNPGGIITGNRTLEVGGVCTIWKQSDSSYKIWGGGLT